MKNPADVRKTLIGTSKIKCAPRELPEAEIQALWIEEAEERLDEMEQGRDPEIPAEEVFRRARRAAAVVPLLQSGDKG